MQKRFSGVVVPMVTPLNKDFTIDVIAVERIIKLFAENGIHPLVLGTTGESSSINEKESLKLVETSVKVKGTNQCIYVGLVGNQVDNLIKRGNQYIALGADCVVATLPSYYGLSENQMLLFYQTLADKISGPVMMYNIKATTQMSIPLEVVKELSKHPNIWGLKDSERDLKRMKFCIDWYKENSNFSFFCGWGAQSFGSLKLGADGIVPSTGNYVPEMYKSLYESALNKDWKNCEKWQLEINAIAKEYQKNKTLGESLAFLKFLMNKKGFCNKTMMPPLTEIK
ncbi:dihydrodipicolinate synthase family protein [Polaribacter vadi]|uniref:Dihydrodipicolinate synthase family protein n=1 Tax=Polaribacter vadi TaxID=1774273 RepID=A0A1B8TT15_9FLAO|nr:dihydrodipicolinate synthase family protein [Polaribacter vadi]AOW17883.1 dihydrodipicolinate synthase family protein [Polaribacter vadi]OBY62608.1 dihydrodipicolinate synthase family protein [Polaribacter vadi]